MPLTELSESALRRIARKRIEDRQLPRIVPERMWGTPKGTGQLCCLCDRAITPDEAMLELDGWPNLRFHVGCHAIWQRECRARDQERSERPIAAGPG
jgi:hypothetical protein